MATERPVEAETLLVLCQANLVRSPLAAAILARLLESSGRADLRVASAGLQVVPGAVVSGEATRVALERGVDLTHRRPRSATAEIVAGASIVVTMTEAQRAAAARLSRAAVTWTFTLRELVRLLAIRGSTAGAPTWAELARAAHSSRPLRPPAVDPEDVPDPVGQDLAFHEAVADDIEGLCDRLASLVVPRASSPTP